MPLFQAYRAALIGRAAPGSEAIDIQTDRDATHVPQRIAEDQESNPGHSPRELGAASPPSSRASSPHVGGCCPNKPLTRATEASISTTGAVSRTLGVSSVPNLFTAMVRHTAASDSSPSPAGDCRLQRPSLAAGRILTGVRLVQKCRRSLHDQLDASVVHAAEP